MRMRSRRAELIDGGIDDADGRIAKSRGDGNFVELLNAVEVVRSAFKLRGAIGGRNPAVRESEVRNLKGDRSKSRSRSHLHGGR